MSSESTQYTLTSPSALEAESALGTVSSQAGHRVSRSCYGCNSKKVRCDKKEPCSSCRRAGRSCDYPPSGPRKRRTKKTIMAEMASRLSNLEKSAGRVREAEVSGQKVPIPENAIRSPMTLPATALNHNNLSHNNLNHNNLNHNNLNHNNLNHNNLNHNNLNHNNSNHNNSNHKNSNHNNLSQRAKDDILVQKGSSSHYFNEIILSRVIEAERNIGSVLTPAPTEPSYRTVLSPFNALGILSSPSLLAVPASYHPSKELALRLWNIYVGTVEGCTGLKVLHIPTHEVKMYSTIDDPKSSSFENLALSFAIYFSATVTLKDSEAQVFSGQDKETLLARLKVGLEQAFAHGDFLDRPTTTGLIALAIYLAALRIHNHGKGMWILNGLAIRIAQSLGLHRDGERLGLSPFQSEIRRRLWWQLLTRDCRACEDYGLQSTSSILLACEVNLPTNVDDIDLYPEMQRLPAPRDAYTTMTFSLVMIDYTKSMQRLVDIGTSSSFSSPPSEDMRAQIISETRARIERLLLYCNPVIPRQRLLLFHARFLLRKLDFVTKLQWTLLQRPGPLVEIATEQNLVAALEILEARFRTEDDLLLKQFAWVAKAYRQYNVTMYILLHLCVKPEGPSIDRAWAAMQTLFSYEVWDQTAMGFGSKSAVLAALKARAESVREKSQELKQRESARTGDRNLDLVSRENTFEEEDYSTYLLEDTLGLDLDMDGWPNWSALIQGFQFGSPLI